MSVDVERDHPVRRPGERLERGTHAGAVEENVCGKRPRFRSARNGKESRNRSAVYAGDFDVETLSDAFVSGIGERNFFKFQNLHRYGGELLFPRIPEGVESFNFRSGGDCERFKTRSVCGGKTVAGNGETDKARLLQSRFENDRSFRRDESKRFDRMKIPFKRAVQSFSRDRFAVMTEFQRESDCFAAAEHAGRAVRSQHNFCARSGCGNDLPFRAERVIFGLLIDA